MLRIIRYGVAVSDELVQYRDVAPSFYLSRRSTQVQTQSNVLPSPRLELNECDRSFGDDRVRNLALVPLPECRFGSGPVVLSVSFSVLGPPNSGRFKFV